MGLEGSVTQIADLNPLWPAGGDERSTVDDHIRLVKTALRSLITFPAGLAQLGFPASVSGQAGKALKVNAGETGFDLGSFSLTTHNHDAAYEPKDTDIQAHLSSTANPHSVTAAQAGAIAALGAYADLVAASKIGTGAAQVAAGNHTHAGSSLTSGELDATGDAIGTGPVDVPGCSATLQAGTYLIAFTANLLVITDTVPWTEARMLSGATVVQSLISPPLAGNYTVSSVFLLTIAGATVVKMVARAGKATGGITRAGSAAVPTNFVWVKIG